MESAIEVDNYRFLPFCGTCVNCTLMNSRVCVCVCVLLEIMLAFYPGKKYPVQLFGLTEILLFFEIRVSTQNR